MLFNGWDSLVRIVVVAICTYALLVGALRLLGAEALAKMSAYDLVVTIALGSIVATVPLSPDVSLADGAAVVLTYLLLQTATRALMRQSARARTLIKAPPLLVLWDGNLITGNQRRGSIPDEEVHAAVRKAGFGSVREVQAVVLENDGQWSVIPRTQAHDSSALAELRQPHA